MRTISITLAGEELNIKQLTVLKADEWRKKFEPEFMAILELTSSASRIDFRDIAASKEQLMRVVSKLSASPQLVRDLIFAYAPELDKKHFLENAYDDEFIKALLEVLRVVYVDPFAPLIQMITELGLQGRQT
jgi:hypothetical protein